MNRFGRFGAAFDRFWFTPVPATRLGAVRILVCAVALYDVVLYAGTVFADARAVDAGVGIRPFNPIYLFQVLNIQPIGMASANALYMTALVALTMGALGVFSRLSCAIGALSFLYWTGLAYSFGKPHHDKVALAFALCALPFVRVGARLSVDAVVVAVLRARRLPVVVVPADDPPVSGIPIRLTQVTIAIGYFGAGAAKVVLGGPDWFNGYTLQGIMLGHDGVWARTFAASPWFCQVQSVMLVFVQVAFPLVFLFPRLRWFFLPAAAGFHLMTWKTMDTGPYMRLWLLLFVFVPMERIPAAMARFVWSGVVQAVVAVGATVLFVALIVSIVHVVVPSVVLVVVLAPLVLTSLLYLWPRAAVTWSTDWSRKGCRGTAALIRGLDFARCVTFVDADRGVRSAQLVDSRGCMQNGVAACSALCWRLPLLMPLALLVNLLRLPRLLRGGFRATSH